MIQKYLLLKHLRSLELDEKAISRAVDDDYQIVGWKIGAEREETRASREVRAKIVANLWKADI